LKRDLIWQDQTRAAPGFCVAEETKFPNVVAMSAAEYVGFLLEKVFWGFVDTDQESKSKKSTACLLLNFSKPPWAAQKKRRS